MKIRPFGLLRLSMVLSLAAPVAGHATSFVDRPFPDTLQETPTVVRGRIGSSSSDWGVSEDGIRRIYTLYDLKVTEVLKGSVNSNSLTMRELGGEKDGVGMHVEGAAAFEKNEDVVVFLGPKNADGSFDLRGLSTGKYSVVKKEDQEYLLGAGVANPNGPETGVQNGPRVKKPMTLDQLRQLISDQSAQGPATPHSDASARPSEIKPNFAASSDTPTPSGSAAPQLQTSPSAEASGFPWTTIVLGSLAALVAALVIRTLRRSRS